jgi:hypothetical protein
MQGRGGFGMKGESGGRYEMYMVEVCERAVESSSRRRREREYEKSRGSDP